MGVAAAVDLVVALLENATAISNLVKEASAQGRSVLTSDEWNTVLAAATAAHTKLESALNA